MSGGGVINPDNILIPNADPDAIEAVGRALKDDAADIAQAGHDITAAWAGLEGHYVAPESEELLAAVDPVAADGDEMDDKITTVGQALIDFAEEIRPLLARWKSLKADAETMAADIAEQGEEWTRDEDRVDEHNQLNNDLAAVQTEYQAAERDCANAITALVEGGTRFVAAELDGSTVPARGEVVYGLAEAPQDMATSWASPQEHDAPWWVDVGAAVGDFVLGGIQDTAGMFGLYHDERGWGADSWGAWRSNLGEYWGQTLATPAYLLGLYNGENLVGSVGEWGTNLATTWGEVAHSVVPWREWDTRPGYVITTAALNLGGIALDIASVAGGTALSATGYGAVLGVPLAVWRGASLLNRLGKFGGLLPDAPSSTPDVNVSLGDRLSLPDGLNLPDGRTPGQVTTDLGDAADALSLPSTRLDALTDALTNADAFGHPPSGDSGHPPGNTPDTGDAPPTRPATAEDHRPPQQPDDSGQPSHPAQDTPAPGGTGSDRDGDTEADTSPTQTPDTAPSDTGQAAELPTTEQILRLHEDIEHFLRQNAEVPVGAGVGGRTPGGPLPDLSPSAHSRDHTPTGEPTGSGGGPGDGPADPPGTRNGDSSPTSGHGDTSTSGGSSANSGGGNSFGRGGNGGPPTGGRLPESGPGEGLDGRTGGNGRSGGSSGEGESNSGLPGEDRNLGDRKDGDNGEEPIRGERDPDNSRSTEETGSDSSAAGESGTGGSDPGGRPVSNPTGGMLPELESSVREELRKAGVDRDIWENVVSRLEKSPYGQRVAELVTSGRLSDVPGYRTVLSMCADKQDLDNRLAAPRMALEHAAELQDAGVTNIAFEHRFTDPDTGQAQDIDVVAFGPDGEPSHGYELKDVLSINGIDKRAKEANQQFDNIDQEALTERIIIIDCHQSVGNFPEAKQRKIERFAERSGTTFRIRFEDGFVTIPDKNIFP